MSVRHPSRASQSPEGNHFHTDPDAGDLRRFSITSAGPASLPRLAAYPRRDGDIMGTGLRGGDEGGCYFVQVLGFAQGQLDFCPPGEAIPSLAISET